MTLSGLAIAIGGLVDDAMIDVENILLAAATERHEARDRTRTGPRSGVRRQQGDSRFNVFATVIAMFVFLPLFFPADVENRPLQPLGLASLDCALCLADCCAHAGVVVLPLGPKIPNRYRREGIRMTAPTPSTCNNSTCTFVGAAESANVRCGRIA